MIDETITEDGAVTLEEGELDQASGGARPAQKIEIEGVALSLNFTKIEY